MTTRNVQACTWAMLAAVAVTFAGCGGEVKKEPPKGAPTEKEMEKMTDGITIDIGGDKEKKDDSKK